MVVYRRKTTGKPEKYDFLNTLNLWILVIKTHHQE